jgi:uncharacterized protein YjbJ (UPF0337 family)
VDTNITYSYANGKLGKGAGFNGTSSKIVIPDVASLKPTSAFTIGALINGADFADDMIFQSFAYPTSKFSGFFLTTASGKARFTIGKGTGNTLHTDYENLLSTIDLYGALHWIVCVWDGSYMKMYVDGVLHSSVAWSNAPGYGATNYVRVGCQSNDGSEISFYQGSIDELFLEASAWTANNIRNKWNEIKGRLKPKMI